MLNENEKNIGAENALESKEESIPEKTEVTEVDANVEEVVDEKRTVGEAEPYKEETVQTPGEAPVDPQKVNVGVKPNVNNRINANPLPKKKKGNAFKTILLTAVCAALAGVIFTTSSMWITYITSEPASSELNIANTGQDSDKIEGTDKSLLNYSALSDFEGELAIEDIVESCIPSVVSITNKGVYEVMTFFGNYQTESISSGSGIIIGQNETELLIVTNYHVVKDSKELTVVFHHDEKQAMSGDTSYVNVAQVKGYDDEKDIAVIAVKLSEMSSDAMKKIKVAAIGNSDEIKLGSRVVAIGNALGYGQSVTHGIVSALDREVTMDGVSGGTTTNKYIQTDAAINGGNSGGALLNMKGELIGINTAKIYSTGVEGMGYAIPITDVEELINNLMSLKTRDVVEEENRGYLGIYGRDVTTEVSEAYGIPVGVFINETVKGSPAAKSDLQTGDIIVKIDGVSVSTMEALQERLSYYSKGEKVVLTVKRMEERRYADVEVEVTLASKEESGIDE